MPLPLPVPVPQLAALRVVAAFLADLVQWAAAGGVVVVSLCIVLCLFRVVRGPTLADRGAAADVIGVQLVGLVILLTMLSGSLLYVDGLLIVSLLSFAGTIAVSQFIARPFVFKPKHGDVPPPDPVDPS